MEEVKGNPIEVSVKCPKCNNRIVFPDVQSIKDIQPGDTNCFYCGVLLLLDDDKAYPMHEKLHSEDSRWPVDGKETEFVEASMLRAGSERVDGHLKCTCPEDAVTHLSGCPTLSECPTCKGK